MSYKKRFQNLTGQQSPISGYNNNTGAWNGPGQNNSIYFGIFLDLIVLPVSFTLPLCSNVA